MPTSPPGPDLPDPLPPDQPAAPGRPAPPPGPKHVPPGPVPEPPLPVPPNPPPLPATKLNGRANRRGVMSEKSAFTALNEKPVVIRINLDHSYEIALSVFQSRSRFPNRKAPLALRRAFFRARAGSRSARSIPSTHPESPTNFAAGIADAPEPPQTSNKCPQYSLPNNWQSDRGHFPALVCALRFVFPCPLDRARL